MGINVVGKQMVTGYSAYKAGIVVVSESDCAIPSNRGTHEKSETNVPGSFDRRFNAGGSAQRLCYNYPTKRWGSTARNVCRWRCMRLKPNCWSRYFHRFCRKLRTECQHCDNLSSAWQCRLRHN